MYGYSYQELANRMMSSMEGKRCYIYWFRILVKTCTQSLKLNDLIAHTKMDLKDDEIKFLPYFLYL